MKVTAAGLDGDGVRLIAPASDGFDALVDQLTTPEYAPMVKTAAPWVVIVGNDAAQTIVALSTRFTIGEGRTQSDHSVFLTAPDAIAGTGLEYGRASDRGIPPGGQRLIGINFAIPERKAPGSPPDFTPEEEAFYLPQVRNWIESTTNDFAGADRVHITLDAVIFEREVHITLDAVIFDDAVLLGERVDQLAPHFEALVRAKQAAYRLVLDRIEGGEDAGAAVKSLFELDDSPDEDWTRESYAANEGRNAVAELLHRYGEEHLAGALRRAILPQTFTVHRHAL